MSDFLEARRVAEQAVLAVGETIRSMSNEVVTQKDGRAYSVVTAADVAAEEQLTEVLSAFDSTIAIRGEELGGDRSASTTWLIDPIDGTGHFTRGMPWANTMIALVVDDQVVASVINNFTTGELYSASKGDGATRNGETIAVVDRQVPNVYVLYDFDLNRLDHASLLADLDSRFPTLNYWSCGHSYVSLAQGSFDGRICKRAGEDTSDWDDAPGALLVSEAGGVVTNIGCDSYDFRNHDFIAATPLLHAYLTEGSDAMFPFV